MANIFISEGAAYRDTFRGVIRLIARSFRIVGLAAGAAIPQDDLRHALVASLLIFIFSQILYPLHALVEAGLTAPKLIICGGVLCAGYIAAWLTEERRRKRIDLQTDEGRFLARSVLDLRLTAVIAGIALCLLVPLAFWQFEFIRSNFSIDPQSSPVAQTIEGIGGGIFPVPAEVIAWITYCLQLYLTALPILDATDVYGLNFSGIEASNIRGLHFALAGRLCFDIVLLTIIFGGLKDTQQQIGIAIARLEDTPEPAIRIGRPIVVRLGQVLNEASDESALDKARFNNAVYALSSIQHSESASTLFSYLDGQVAPNADARTKIDVALARLGPAAAQVIRKRLQSELDTGEGVVRPLEALLDGLEKIATPKDIGVVLKVLERPRNARIARKSIEIAGSIALKEQQRSELIEALKVVHSKLPSHTAEKDRQDVQSRAAKLRNRLMRRRAKLVWLFSRAS